MDLNNNKNIPTLANKITRISNLIGGCLISLFVISAGAFLTIALPTARQVGLIMLAVGLIFIILTIAIFVRSSKKPLPSEDAASGKVTFANFTPDSVKYSTPAGTLDASSVTGNIRAWLAPVMPTAITSVSVLGAATYQHQENTLLLTDSAIVALQIPPSNESTSDSIIGSVLSVLPTDAETKNTLTSSFDRSSIRETVAAEVATKSVETLMQTHYSFAVPFSEIVSVEFRKIGGIHVQTQTLGTFRWLSGFHEDEKFLESMRAAGLPVAFNQT